ncbi:MAG: ATP-binding protein [Holophagaceae bacterium]|nr:ATP-binding protein [Holophagaceae bacterium]
MTSSATDPRQLLEAFAAFTVASNQLQSSYESLQNQLSMLQNEFQTVLEAVPFAIWVLGENGELRFSNRPEALPGTFTDGLPPWELGSPNGLRRFRDLEDMDHFLEQETRPTEKGQIVILRDVTEQHLRAQQTNREERLQAMGMMAAELAHEIRNPLGSLALFAGMLVEDLCDVPESLELSRKIQDGVQRLNTLVTNILTFSRDLSPKPTTISLKSFWEEAKNATGVSEELDWRNKIPATASWHGDPDLLRQVAVNLLQNSLRAMEDCPKPKLTLTASKETIDSKLCWHIALGDNGCGIPKDSLSRIFDPFYSTFGGGTGLGLAVSHRIITAHNGILHVESEAGKGTTIRLRLRAGE